jgi:hypothetical protein
MEFYSKLRHQRYQELQTEASNERRLPGQSKKRTTRPEKDRDTMYWPPSSRWDISRQRIIKRAIRNME